MQCLLLWLWVMVPGGLLDSGGPGSFGSLFCPSLKFCPVNGFFPELPLQLQLLLLVAVSLLLLEVLLSILASTPPPLLVLLPLLQDLLAFPELLFLRLPFLTLLLLSCCCCCCCHSALRFTHHNESTAAGDTTEFR